MYFVYLLTRYSASSDKVRTPNKKLIFENQLVVFLTISVSSLILPLIILILFGKCTFYKIFTEVFPALLLLFSKTNSWHRAERHSGLFFYWKIKPNMKNYVSSIVCKEGSKKAQKVWSKYYELYKGNSFVNFTLFVAYSISIG